MIPAGRIVISEDACAQCLLRAKKCPGGAVRIVNLPTNLSTDCTHRYGPNAFKLHGLPSPRAGCVLGLLGTNGIGKSTALKVRIAVPALPASHSLARSLTHSLTRSLAHSLKVLAGKLKPNLGRLVDPPSWEEILAYYRGSDLQVRDRGHSRSLARSPSLSLPRSLSLTLAPSLAVPRSLTLSHSHARSLTLSRSRGSSSRSACTRARASERASE